MIFFIKGIKKGIAELADIVAITKYDDNLMQEARRVKTEYLSASKFIRKRSKYWTPKVIYLNIFKHIELSKSKLNLIRSFLLQLLKIKELINYGNCLQNFKIQCSKISNFMKNAKSN
jgi:hypothetical protein